MGRFNKSERKVTKREFYLTHIFKILNQGTRPALKVYNHGATLDVYYIIGWLPTRRLAVYHRGSIKIAKGFTDTGKIIFDQKEGEFRPQNVRKTANRSYNEEERNLVLTTRQLIKYHYGEILEY